jgi:hypothetical protein
MMLFVEVTLSVNQAKVVPTSIDTQTTREMMLSANAFLVDLFVIWIFLLFIFAIWSGGFGEI